MRDHLAVIAGLCGAFFFVLLMSSGPMSANTYREADSLAALELISQSSGETSEAPPALPSTTDSATTQEKLATESDPSAELADALDKIKEAATHHNKPEPESKSQPSKPSKPAPASSKLVPVRNLEECKRSLEGRDMSRTLKHLTWMHFPKCGSSFGALIHAYACTGELDESEPNPELPSSAELHDRNRPVLYHGCYCGARQLWDNTLWKQINWGEKYCYKDIHINGQLLSHNILWRSPAQFQQLAGSFVAMFRDPRRRLASGWNAGKHHFGMTRPAFDSKLARAERIDAYLAEPAIKSCQTKMVTGRYCAEATRVTPATLDLAISRLDSFAFAGLTDYWNQSVCLFHHMHGGKVEGSQFQDSRIGFGYSQCESNKLLNNPRLPVPYYSVCSDYWKNISVTVDPYDWKLFKAVKQRFIDKMAEYGLLFTESDDWIDGEES
eukprot:m.47642 g.47642  ORF g.47642 m.47642 type:complete len:440 (+) comp6369_c0_seq2:83-1402(+)